MEKEKKKNLIVIRDNAHGIDVLGKQSPDGTHKEYLWSREVWDDVTFMLKILGYVVEPTSTGVKEIGLTNRVLNGNSIAAKYPKQTALFISLHNDASKNDGPWGTARGVSIWTSKGRDQSDVFAEIMLKALFRVVKETRHRVYSPKEGERDFEAGFTVIAGTKTVKPMYNGLLIECGFQDNKEDLRLLQDPQFKKKIADAIVDGIEDINTYLESLKTEKK